MGKGVPPATEFAALNFIRRKFFDSLIFVQKGETTRGVPLRHVGLPVALITNQTPATDRPCRATRAALQRL